MKAFASHLHEAGMALHTRRARERVRQLWPPWSGSASRASHPGQFRGLLHSGHHARVVGYARVHEEPRQRQPTRDEELTTHKTRDRHRTVRVADGRGVAQGTHYLVVVGCDFCQVGEAVATRPRHAARRQLTMSCGGSRSLRDRRSPADTPGLDTQEPRDLSARTKFSRAVRNGQPQRLSHSGGCAGAGGGGHRLRRGHARELRRVRARGPCATRHNQHQGRCQALSRTERDEALTEETMKMSLGSNPSLMQTQTGSAEL